MSSTHDIFNVVIGTAGHIDHGKSSLVQRLTGIDPDRLPEEKDRGLTIDLGFAPWTLENGMRVGIVDVPGHERLIKNMVAGSTGIDLVLLVIAADDSVMPQTREHLTIMQILGLEHGVVAITKIDAVERDFVELVRDEVSEVLEGTFLEDAPIVEVSSITGEGFDELGAVLNRKIGELQPREEGGVFRMPVQRIFSPKGFGTVVTGIPVSGAVRVGEALEIVDLETKGRVRGIQAYKESADVARAGHSAAINISDVDYRKVRRGMVAAEPGYFSGATMLEATLSYLPDNRRPLIHQSEVRVHIGTAEVLGKVFLLEGKSLDAGAEAFVQYRLSEPVVTAPGDRYVLRLHSPMETLGGGEIIDRSRWRLKSGKQYVIEHLRTKKSAVGDTRKSLLNILGDEGNSVLGAKELSKRVGLPLDDVRGLLDDLTTSGDARESSRAGLYLSMERLAAAADDARELAARFFADNRLRLLMDKALLRERLKCHDVFLDDLLSSLAAAGDLEIRERGMLSWRDFGPQLDDAEKSICDAIRDATVAGGCSPPAPAELASDRGWNEATVTDLYGLLEERGELRRLADGVWFHREVLDDVRGKLRAFLEENGRMTAGEAKDILGSTRKFSIPLLEHLDREGFTIRKGDYRELRPSTD